MAPGYCRNVVAFLQRRVDEITLAAVVRLISTRLPDEATQAYLIVTESLDSELRRLGADPLGWLNDKPLIKALQQRAAKGD
jgi:hypothetical protein